MRRPRLPAKSFPLEQTRKLDRRGLQIAPYGPRTDYELVRTNGKRARLGEVRLILIPSGKNNMA